MKKVIIALIVSAFLFAGCSGNSDGVVEISERFFFTQINNIVLNHNEYLGKTIQYEGMFGAQPIDGEEDDVYVVYRFLLDCCGPAGVTGFMVDLGDFEPPPAEAWVEVVGVLEEFVGSDGLTRLRLALTSITELPERGNEFIQL